MTSGTLIGPATLVYLVSATVAALWWASALATRVETLERSTVTAERIARLEAEVGTLADATKDLKLAVHDLVQELREK